MAGIEDYPAVVVSHLWTALKCSSFSNAEDREVELDDDYRTKKADRSKEANLEISSVSETNEEGIMDNFAGMQQHMNAFDLLQPLIERQLRSGI